jgi:hypothetical protein
MDKNLEHVDTGKHLTGILAGHYAWNTFGFEDIPRKISLHHRLGPAENANAHEGGFRSFLLRFGRRRRAGLKGHMAVHTLLSAFLILNSAYGTVGHNDVLS